MPWPTALTAITIHGKIVAADSSQTPATGTVRFQMPYALMDAGDNVIVGPQMLVATLDALGEFTIALPATNDPDISPSGWTYRVTVNTSVWKQTFFIEVPYDGGALEFSDIAPAVTPPVVQTYSLLGHTHAAGAGGGTYRGVWQSGVSYNAGDTVTYGRALYGTSAGALAGDTPVVVKELYTGSLTTTDVADTGDYQFTGFFNTTKTVRATGLQYLKTATEIAVPHEVRLYDVGWSTSTALASATVPGEVAGGTGRQTAPILGDLIPGRSYAVAPVLGAGADAGYSYTPAFAFPHSGSGGSLTLTSGGFSNSHANITTITNPGTYYAGGSVRWEEPSAAWDLIARFDPVVVGAGRALFYPIVPV